MTVLNRRGTTTTTSYPPFYINHLSPFPDMPLSSQAEPSNPSCPNCGCKNVVKKGKRRNRLQTLQIFQCAECLHRFTGSPGKNKTYPLKLILETISTFNLGHSLTQTQSTLRERFHRHIPERTISSWLTEYRPLTTYARLRAEGRNLFAPNSIVRTSPDKAA